MALVDLADWMDEFERPEKSLWYIKRLSANDTLANNAHQAGPYIPKSFLFRVFPQLDTSEVKNPDAHFDLYIDSHVDYRRVRAVYYNGKRYGDGTRDESRLTNFGGRTSALLDPESTGALAVFAFLLDDAGQANECHVWVSRHPTEEDLVEERIGPVEPGQLVVWEPGIGREMPSLLVPAPRTSCRLSSDEISPAWLEKFPSGEEIIRKAVELRSATGLNPDARLMRRRVCEFEVFQSIEEAYFLPRISAGFPSIEAFISQAHAILQSRKSRSGNSLELHARQIFIEEGLRSLQDFQHRPRIENGKIPDFLFPSKTAYEDADFPATRLRMLAAKTTCKDRWRQVLNEADRIPVKHLLTLQEGVSEGQFREMKEAGVQLVVPTGLHDSFPENVRPNLVSFEEFIGDIRLILL
ncbi:type II restriction endonuclease [Xanthobacter autotrophicus]|uniref:type II restriction endonuclease n=1 Tax=Xanthobacter TaxID=279 RepID=UPI0024AC2AED|nr:type II restriction endonuclease [Xanthobacter autotrophicus]MDI4665400.1 type II restriction endonuclease [Xanthobacter autotrophicus]